MGYNPAKAVAYALRQVGKPYRYGGAGAAFDCSELTMKALAEGGVSVPHNAAQQAIQLHAVGNSRANRKKLRPGDLMFYYGTVHDPKTFSHVAIYIGKNKLGQYMVVAAVDEKHGVMKHRSDWALKPSGFGFVGHK